MTQNKTLPTLQTIHRQKPGASIKFTADELRRLPSQQPFNKNLRAK